MRQQQTQDFADGWNLALVATCEALPASLLQALAGAVTACGGWVLSHGAVGERCAEIDFEFPRAHSMDLYSLLVASGLVMSREAHQQLTGLCHCTLQLGRVGSAGRADGLNGDVQSDFVRVYLSVYAGPGTEQFPAGAAGPMREAA